MQNLCEFVFINFQTYKPETVGRKSHYNYNRNLIFSTCVLKVYAYTRVGKSQFTAFPMENNVAINK